MDIPIDRFASAAVALKRKRPDAALFEQFFEDLQLQSLEFNVSVRCLAQCDDLFLFWDRKGFHRERIFLKLIHIGGFPCGKTAETHEDN